MLCGVPCYSNRAHTNTHTSTHLHIAHIDTDCKRTHIKWETINEMILQCGCRILQRLACLKNASGLLSGGKTEDARAMNSNVANGSFYEFYLSQKKNKHFVALKCTE